MFNIFSITGTNPKAVNKTISKVNVKIDSKLKDNDTSENNLNISSSSTSGLSLFQQLQRLKTNPIVNRIDTYVADNSKDIENNTINENIYISEPISIPIDPISSKVIKSSAESTISNMKNNIEIHRDLDIQTSRLLLPVCGMEQEIVEAINSNDVIILCGETGSGKSTQVPQFLYEAGYGNSGLIGITQPRRVAAMTTAQRVAVELNQNQNDNTSIVGYQIRFDSATMNEFTKIKFMTDGILLREITSDLLLRKYSAIILDEAHERNINTDVLLGLLSRSIIIRKKESIEEMNAWNQISVDERINYNDPIKPLKLVIMSATLRIDDFCNPALFTPIPPVIKVEARQYPVTTHFSRRTELKDYVKESFKKVCQIHNRLPDGGVLVFLTGKREVLQLCRKLNKKINKSYIKDSEYDNSNNEIIEDIPTGGMDNEEVEGDNDIEYEINEDNDDSDDDSVQSELSDLNYTESDVNIDEQESESKDPLMKEMLSEVLGKPNLNEDKVSKDKTHKREIELPSRAYILPLFAMMSTKQQQLVFQTPPEGHRLIVIATNVAETSITIPNIKYVVDCGRQKEKVVDLSTGITKYEVCWISKASSEQRKGRAGRTGPGHCYRLYSSAFYDQHMTLFKPAEILSTPLEDLILQMRTMGITDLESFPFPTNPSKVALKKAVDILNYLGVIIKPKISLKRIIDTFDSTIKSNNNKAQKIFREYGFVSEIGKLIAKFPINPRLAKMLVLGHRANILVHVIGFVSMILDKSPFQYKKQNIIINGNHSGDDSDGEIHSETDYKNKNKADIPIYYHPQGDSLARLKALSFDNKLSAEFNPPSKIESIGLRQVLLSGFCDCIAKRLPVGSIEIHNNDKHISRRKRLTAYISCDPNIVEPLYIHPHSALYPKDPTSELPEYVIYTSLIRNDQGDTTYMNCVTVINSSWIPLLTNDSPLLKWSEPLESPSPYYDNESDNIMCYVKPKYGCHDWEFPPVTKPLVECVVYSINNKQSAVMSIDNSPIGYRKVDLHYRWFGKLLLEGLIIKGELSSILSKSNYNITMNKIIDMKPNINVSLHSYE
eukprot:gene19781-25721_t